MESGRSMEVAKLCKKMHKHAFNGKDIDLPQVMKDVYENFTSIFKAMISQYENLDRKFHGYYHEDECFKFRKRLGFLITFSRCMLKWCVDEGTVVVINKSLIDILTDIESHFVDLLECCTTLVSREEFRLSQQVELLKMTSVEHMVSRVSNAFLAVFSTESLPPSMGFVHSNESMVEFLDQVLEDLNQCDMEGPYIKVSVEKIQLLRNYLQFTEEYWMRGEGSEEFLVWVEVVAESAACYSFIMTKHDNFDWEEQYYLQIENRLKSNMSTAGVVVWSGKISNS